MPAILKMVTLDIAVLRQDEHVAKLIHA